MGSTDNMLVSQAATLLSATLPEGWRIERANELSMGRHAVLLALTAPDGESGSVVAMVCSSLTPRLAQHVVATRFANDDGGREPVRIVIAPWLSPSTRDVLRKSKWGYLDLTGNIALECSRPGLFVRTDGAGENPEPEQRPARSLSGLKAARVVRNLIETRKPAGVRELAQLTGVDAGHVSRLLTLLDEEAIVFRVFGRPKSVEWEPLLRRWAAESPISTRGVVRMAIDLRGLDAFADRLRDRNELGAEGTYAITGSLAAARIAPIAPPRLATVWVRDLESFMRQNELIEASTGGNVMLVEASDPLPLENAGVFDRLRYATVAQVAADLLSSPGRAPAEAEALIAWMRVNEGAWRTR